MTKKKRLFHLATAGIIFSLLVFIFFTIPPVGLIERSTMLIGLSFIIFLITSIALKKKFALILSIFILFIMIMRILRILDMINLGILSSLVIALFIYFK